MKHGVLKVNVLSDDDQDHRNLPTCPCARASSHSSFISSSCALTWEFLLTNVSQRHRVTSLKLPVSNATTDLFPGLALGFQEVLGTRSPASRGASAAAAAAAAVAEHPLARRHDASGLTIVQPRPPPLPAPSAPSCCQLSRRLIFLLLLQPPPSSPPSSSSSSPPLSSQRLVSSAPMPDGSAGA